MDSVGDNHRDGVMTNVKRTRKRTPIFIEVHTVKNSLCLLRTFLQSLQEPANWQTIIPIYLAACIRVVDEIDTQADTIAALEAKSIGDNHEDGVLTDGTDVKHTRNQTPIFLEVQKVKNLLCPLRTFLQALEQPARWQSIIPTYLPDCIRIIEEIDHRVDTIADLEAKALNE